MSEARPVVIAAALLTAIVSLVACGLANDAESEAPPIASEGAAVRATAKRPLTVCAKDCDFREIQPAIDAAASGEIVRVYRGTYAGPLIVQRHLILRGDGPHETIITGGIPAVETRCVPGVEVLFEGLAISNGGGVSNVGCALTLRDVAVTENAVHGSGAGISNAGRLHVRGSDIARNEARATGGGISNREGATLSRIQTSLRHDTPGGCAGTACP